MTINDQTQGKTFHSFFPCNYISKTQDKEKPMYKSKLQELCQKQKWAFPKYTYIKYGEDHCPQFKASVVVSGITFDNHTVCMSSKQALNQAAQVAFLHFIASQPSNQRSEEYVEKANSEKEVQSSKISEDMMTVKHYQREGFKRKLNIYAQSENLDLPLYLSEKKGHCFTALVSIGEDWFQSRGLCESAEEAENSATEAALLSLLTDAFHENDPCSYKALLQELASNERFFLPTNTTIRYNESHSQTFSFIVEVNGEAFHGAITKSKKLAELSAAKAAYTVFIERKLFEPSYFSSHPSSGDIIKLARRLGSATISDHQENPTNGFPNYADNSMKKDDEKKSYLLRDKVRVFTCMPNMALPKGTVVLPISENKWTIVTLEFPNEKGM